MRTLVRLACTLFLLTSLPAWGVSPYITGYRMHARGVPDVMQEVEARLAAQHFEILGRHQPAGLGSHGTVIVTDRQLREAARLAGGAAIVGAVLRVGVRADGATFYANPEYWQRAFFRRRYEALHPLIADVQRRLGRALGVGTPFGGDVPALDLVDYRYMIGMEKFDSKKNALRTYPSFNAAVETIRSNLNHGVAGTSMAYELVLKESRLAVFGVTMNDPQKGEAPWLKRLGLDHIAAMPYEIYVVDRQAGALYGRYRIALGWPGLGMGSFMGIRDVPLQIKDTLLQVTAAP